MLHPADLTPASLRDGARPAPGRGRSAGAAGALQRHRAGGADPRRARGPSAAAAAGPASRARSVRAHERADAIAMITSGFPRISETFALNELLALDRAGAIEAIFATKPGDGSPPQPGAESLTGRVELLPAGSARGAGAHGWRSASARGRDRGVHAYFAHTPAAVAERAAEAARRPVLVQRPRARRPQGPARASSRRRARRAACVIACNDDVAGSLRRIGARSSWSPRRRPAAASPRPPPTAGRRCGCWPSAGSSRRRASRC